MSTQISHPEWITENALTSPSDRNPDRSYMTQLSLGQPNLTEPEVTSAVNQLNIRDFVEKFPTIERMYADTPIPLQVFGLISFVPAKGAVPDKDGIYGFAKLRGNFSCERECNERAEFIIRNIDSYHRIYHAYVGRPFPLSHNPKYVAETAEIDIRRSTTDNISANIKKQKDDERQAIQEIKDIEKALLDDVK